MPTPNVEATHVAPGCLQGPGLATFFQPKVITPGGAGDSERGLSPLLRQRGGCAGVVALEK